MRIWNLVALALVLSACGSDEVPANNAAGGSGGAEQDAAGSGGTGGLGGSSGTGGTAGSDQDAMTGTRCDNGIGAGGDGCAESWTVLGKDIGFSVSPDPLTTNLEGSDAPSVHGVSFFTIPDSVLSTIQDGTTVRSLADGSAVPVTTAWEDHLTWEHHEVRLTLTPSSPLADGWYAVDVQGSLDTGHNSLIWIPEVGSDHYQSAFRVGSAPVLLSAGACGGVVTIGFSEDVLVPEPAPVTVKSIGLDLTKTCTRDTTSGAATDPTRVLTLQCPELNDIDGARILVAAGIETAAQVPLKTAAGATTAEIVLDKDLGSNACRSWQETVVPSF